LPIKKIKWAIGVAHFNGWTLGFFGGVSWLLAGISLLGGEIPWTSLFVAAALTIVTAGEFIGASRLRRLDLTGPRFLALNQLALIGLLAIYCAWQAYSSWKDGLQLPSEMQHSGNPDVDALLTNASGMIGP